MLFTPFLRIATPLLPTRNVIWVGTTPTGSKIKSDSGVRKCAASTTKESTRSKTTKKNHPSNEEDVPMEEPGPEEIVLSSQGSKARRMIIDSPTASDTKVISTQTKPTVNQVSSKAKPSVPKSQSAIDDTFNEDEAVDSDGGGDPGDDDNEYLNDGDDDLKELGPGALQQQLADEVQIITRVTWSLLPFSFLFQSKKSQMKTTACSRTTADGHRP
ncbi:hypothetical protein B0H14DRAFT_3457846 [Mycena olivaceomarginata]|nr:hypothetical protein B0H14DRAFT_3457846 [Mycena olivaceomarginata]